MTALTLRAAIAFGQDELVPYERYQRGSAALEAKDAPRALPDLEAAASVFRRDPDVLYALAKAKALTGDADGAIRRSRARSLSATAPAPTRIRPSRRSRMRTVRHFERCCRKSSQTDGRSEAPGWRSR